MRPLPGENDEALHYAGRVDAKLAKAEREALAVLKSHGLPVRRHAHGYDCDLLTQEIDELALSDREKRKVLAARNVLLNAIAVREAVARGDVGAALDAMSRVVRTPELIDHAYRGEVVRRGAAASGQQKANKTKATLSLRDQKLRQQASQIRAAHPDWPDTQVARKLIKDNKLDLSQRTVRRIIAK